MAMKVKVELLHDGFRELFKSEGIVGLQDEAGKRMCDEANAALDDDKSRGFESHTWYGNYGGGRYITSVSAIDYQATNAEQKNKVLSRAVHA